MAEKNDNAVVVFWIALLGWFCGFGLFTGVSGWSVGSVFWVIGGLVVLCYLGSQIRGWRD